MTKIVAATYLGVQLLNEKPLYIDDTPALTPIELKSRARRVARQFPEGLGMIMIDYLPVNAGGRRWRKSSRRDF